MAERLAVVAEGLRKRYGDHYALNGFDLAVPEGTVCGLLGPNGAGKTTAVRILATLLQLTDGRAEVAGLDVATRPLAVKRKIGLVGQHAAVDEILSGRQNLELFGRLFHLGARQARRRADELLDQFGLTDAADRPAKTYSGGMRRRLDIAAGMILAPQVLFLDEPTTGLDPRSRSEVWQAVRDMVAAGTSVLLTTQYLDEADQLADRISVINHGVVIAEGTPDQLKSKLGGDRIDVVLHATADLPRAAELTGKAAGAIAEVDQDTRRISVQVTDRVTALVDVAQTLKAARIDVEDIALRRPTLDEVFLSLTEKEAAA
ncbi:ATP-binding cassette domain-containing protein [Kibdelosporangium persicum]|uniref:Daunorubicin resistance ABC transporter ATPase subunit n=1 Tax=Kibdelosporangium persicum TaxID=2698649 RepID=A0ABX2F2L0_9PSEU|nr:ATP-binding cassette domain-containing protein [Kibdelosporangium persicum]NRN65354.1 Daunorubicin resistance ABC transporter ATPase subunit [Kibdelosporangium persicum]